MPSFNNERNTAEDAPRLVVLDSFELSYVEETPVHLALTATEAQELLSRVLNSNEEDTDAMSNVILKLADAIRQSARSTAVFELETYPASRAA